MNALWISDILWLFIEFGFFLRPVVEIPYCFTFFESFEGHINVGGWYLRSLRFFKVNEFVIPLEK